MIVQERAPMAWVKIPPLFLVAVFLAFLSGLAGPSFGSHEVEEKGASEEPPNHGPLDGMIFTGMLGPDGKPKDVEDVFVFENGTFISKECELRCDYPARPYFVREVDGKTEFISHTKCPYKDAWIVWHGIVEGDRITGTAIWTIKRWYWTMTNRYEFEGKLTPAPPQNLRVD